MKFGVLYNAANLNIGDDIQAYAASKFLPSVDYLVDRETISTFRSKNDEPVAVIMNAWYMWEKWHWPPSKCIIPHMIGIHYSNHKLANQWEGSPLQFEALEGIGKEYLKAYQPIGCRDYFTRDELQKRGINSYFSGCVTLTLPKMEKKESNQEYICVVDCDKKVCERIKNMLQNTDMELKVISHKKEVRNPKLSWDERVKRVEELLTLYRNAKCVITNRLHCALPCLAQETPVLLVKAKTDDIRFSPYYEFLHRTTVKEFLSGDYDYDILHPPLNKTQYIEIREKLIKSCQKFVESMLNETGDIEQLNKFHFDTNRIKEWQFELMDYTLHKWLYLMRERDEERKELQKKYADRKKTLEKEIKELKRELELTKKSNVEYKKENEKLLLIVNSKTVRWARKIRKIIKG